MSLADCLDGGARAVIYRGASGDRLYTDIAPTLRSLGNTGGKHQAGSGAFKVVKPDGSYRPITPNECEKLMGWPIDSTAKGITADGKEIAISNTQRHKMLGNGIIPQEIESICNSLRPFLEQTQADYA